MYSCVIAISFVVILAGLIFFLLKPFLSAILLGTILAYLFYPLNKSLCRLVPKSRLAKQLAAAITCLIIALSVILPLVFLVVTLVKESDLIFLLLAKLPLLNFIPRVELFWPYLNEALISLTAAIALTLPNLLLSSALTLIVAYYFLLMAADLYKGLLGLCPFLEQGELLARFNGLSQGMVKGQILVGVVQGMLTGLACFFLGVPSVVFIGFVTAIVSAIPFFGAAMVWVPVVGYLLLINQVFKAMVMLACGLLVISTIDNFLKPKIVGESASVHPLLVLFGIVGGVQVFGVVGLLIGPFILTSLDIMLKLFQEAF